MPISESLKKAQDKYDQTSDGIARKKRYDQTEKGKKSNLERHKRYIKRLREQAIIILGGVCKNCGEGNSSLLEIDHINGKGGKDREDHYQYQIYRNIINNPECRKDYQLLCKEPCHTDKTDIDRVNTYVEAMTPDGQKIEKDIIKRANEDNIPL